MPFERFRRFRSVATAVLLVWLLGAAGGWGATVRVSLDLPDGAEPVAVHLAARPVAEKAAVATPPAIDLAPGATDATLALPDEPKSWRLEATAKGFWSEAVAIDLPRAAPVRIELWPAGTIAAKVKPPQGDPVPETIALRLLAPEEEATRGKQPDRAELDCPLDEKGALACPAPAGHWDVRATSGVYVPLYFWRRALAAGAKLDLATLALRPGGSIEGRVVTEDGPADPKTTKVKLEPQGMGRSEEARETNRRIDAIARTAGINAWGYFQLRGVPPGAYRLEATAPELQPAELAPVRVEVGDPVELRDPLVLQPAARLRVAVDPPVHPLTGKWKLSVTRRPLDGGSVLEELATGTTNEEGLWLSPALPPGKASVFVQDREGGHFTVSRETTLVAGTQDLLVELPLVLVDGRVEIGDDPVAAHLQFGRNGDEQVEVESDEEGRFVTVLPHGGTWPLDVEAFATGILSLVETVEVDPPRGTHEASITIELPDTEIDGRVVDEDGRIVDEGTIRVHGVKRGAGAGIGTVWIGRDGTFRVRGLAPGRYQVWAEAAGGSKSNQQDVDVEESLVPPPLELVVRRSTTLPGRVVAAGAPVAGAWILALPQMADPSVWGQPSQAHTDVAGRFNLDLPAATTSVEVVVLAPGHTLRLVRVPLAPPWQSLEVGLESSGAGTLVIPPPAGPATGRPLQLLLFEGEPLPADLLFNWVSANGGSWAKGEPLVVPAMPPGRYLDCRLEFTELRMVVAGRALPKADACDEGDLVPGGTLELHPPGI